MSARVVRDRRASGVGDMAVRRAARREVSRAARAALSLGMWLEHMPRWAYDRAVRDVLRETLLERKACRREIRVRFGIKQFSSWQSDRFNEAYAHVRPKVAVRRARW